MTEREYRAVPRLGYSALKCFNDDRNAFYREYILRQRPREEKQSYAMKFGSLVDCLLLSPESYSERFAEISYAAMPSGQLKDFVDNLWNKTKACLSEGGQIACPFTQLLYDAYMETAFDRNGLAVAFKRKTFQDVVERFEAEGRPYYDSLRHNYGKTVVDARMLEAAERTVRELQTNTKTAPILERTTHRQHPVLFRYRGMDLKSLIDFMEVDHLNGMIYLYDLKTSGWDVGAFDSQILKMRYYLQWSLYYKALEAWSEEQGLDYIIQPMQFLVVSADLAEAPLIYTTSPSDLALGLEGFTLRGKHYRGVNQLIDELSWHLEMDIWNMTREDYRNGGVRKVSLFEEI